MEAPRMEAPRMEAPRMEAPRMEAPHGGPKLQRAGPAYSFTVRMVSPASGPCVVFV